MTSVKDAAVHWFAVVDRTGRVYSNRARRPCIYDTEGKARAQAKRKGDSVVRVTIHLDCEPLFIKGTTPE